MPPRLVCFLAIVGVLSLTGCANTQLRHSTVAQASTLSDLQYQMVLENLAMFAANPGSMPWHVNLTGGASQVTDSGQGSLGLGFNAYRTLRNSFLNVNPIGSASRTIVQQWGHTPVTDGDELRLLRVAYRRACGSPEMPDPELLDDIAHELKNLTPSTEDLRTESYLFYQDLASRQHTPFETLAREMNSTVGDQRIIDPKRPSGVIERKTPLAREVAHQVDEIVDELRNIRPGWYGVGGKRDVPRNACHVANYGDRYVWVCPSGVDGLTRFTLSILEMASALHPPSLNATGSNGVSYSPGFATSF